MFLGPSPLGLDTSFLLFIKSFYGPPWPSTRPRWDSIPHWFLLSSLFVVRLSPRPVPVGTRYLIPSFYQVLLWFAMAFGPSPLGLDTSFLLFIKSFCGSPWSYADSRRQSLPRHLLYASLHVVHQSLLQTSCGNHYLAISTAKFICGNPLQFPAAPVLTCHFLLLSAPQPGNSPAPIPYNLNSLESVCL